MRVVRNTAIYFLTSAINSGISFLLLPVFTRFLSPEAYGHVAIFTSFVSFATPFIGMSMQLNIARDFFRVDKAEMARVVSNLVVAVGLHVALVLAAVSVVGLVLGDVAGLGAPWLQFAVVIAAAEALLQFAFTVLRNLGLAARYGAFQVTQILLNIGLSVVLVAGFQIGWTGRAIGFLIAAVAMSGVGLAWLFRSGYLVPDLDRRRLRAIYAISLPLIPHSLAGIVMGMSGRLFLDAMVGKDAVGLFAVAFTLSSVISLVMTAFNQAWSPWVYQQLADLDDGRRRRIVRQTWAVFGGLAAMAALVPVIAPLVLRVMTTREYAGSAPYVAWLVPGFAFQGAYLLVMPYLVQAGRTGVLATITTAAAVVNLAANYVLIRFVGPLGAAQALTLAYGVSFSLVWWHANKAMPMPWFAWWTRTPREGAGR